MSGRTSDQGLEKDLGYETSHSKEAEPTPDTSPDSRTDEKALLRQTSARPRSFRQFWRGEWKDEQRVPIWHNELAETRLMVAKEWVKTTLTLCVAILSILSIFWGFFLHVDKNLGSFVVWVVDFDGQMPYSTEPFVGPLVVEAAEAIAASKSPHLGFGSLPASFFHNNVTEVREAIYNNDAWAAIVIMPNATALLRQAIETGNASYDPNGACQTIFVQTRDLSAHSSYISPQLAAFQAEVVAKVGTAWAKNVLQNSSLDFSLVQRAPQALSPAIGFTTIDLRPFSTPTATAAVTVGLIYLIIVSFFSFSFFMPTHGHFVNQLEGHRRVYFGHLVIWKYTSTVGAYFFMSLAYSLVSLAMQVPFSHQPASHVEVAPYANGYGEASFVVYWMINFVGMCALGLACENAAMILGQPWSALWLIFWVITNVPVSFYPIEIAPQFYYYGYAWPLHNIVQATKVVLFDVYSEFGLNFGILLAWWAINTALFPLCAWWFRQVHLRNAHKRELLRKLHIPHVAVP